MWLTAKDLVQFKTAFFVSSCTTATRTKMGLWKEVSHWCTAETDGLPSEATKPCLKNTLRHYSQIFFLSIVVAGVCIPWTYLNSIIPYGDLSRCVFSLSSWDSNFLRGPKDWYNKGAAYGSFILATTMFGPGIHFSAFFFLLLRIHPFFTVTHLFFAFSYSFHIPNSVVRVSS